MKMFLVNLPTYPFSDIIKFLIARVSRKEEEQPQAATLLPTYLCLGLLSLPAHHLSLCSPLCLSSSSYSGRFLTSLTAACL